MAGAQALHEFGGERKALRMRRIRGADRRIAAQCDDVAHASVPVFVGDGEHVIPARADAGEVRRGHERGLRQNAPHRAVRPLARAAVGAVSHGHETRRERLQAFDRTPERLLHFGRVRREELERHLEGMCDCCVRHERGPSVKQIAPQRTGSGPWRFSGMFYVAASCLKSPRCNYGYSMAELSAQCKGGCQLTADSWQLTG